MITFKKEEDDSILCRTDSSNIIQFIYNKKSLTLMVFFKKGNVYTYNPVSKNLYDSFESAESHGKAFIASIKNNPSINFIKNTKITKGEVDAILNRLKG